MKIWVLHSKIKHTANHFIITWNFLTVKIIFCIKKNDTKSVHPPEYISKSVQNAKSSDQKILTTYPSPIVQSGKAKFSGSKTSWFWACKWKYGSKVKPCISVMTVVENHSGAGGIQYIFTPKWTYWEDMLISCKTTWCRVIKNKAYFY